MGRYGIILKPDAIRDLDSVRKYDATQILDAIEKHLSHKPTRVSKRRIKRLRGITNPDYRLRVGDFRVFYVVDDDAQLVEVLRVMHKDKTRACFEELNP